MQQEEQVNPHEWQDKKSLKGHRVWVPYIRDKGQLAVQQLQRADAAYAEAVANAFGTANKPMLDMTIATPLSDDRWQ